MPPERKERRLPRVNVPLPCLTILIADDNHDVADSLAVLLQLDGHLPVVTYNGRDATNLAREYCPQMAILDIHMPDLDGLATARALRAQYGGLIYIAAHSGVELGDAAKRARNAGFDRFVVKPVSADCLYEMVRAAQDLAVALREGADPDQLHPGIRLTGGA